MPAARNRRFLDLVRKVPGFGFADELKELVERHGVGVTRAVHQVGGDVGRY